MCCVSITDEVIELIKSSKMPLYKISHRSGVSRRTIYDWIYKGAIPTLENAQCVITALGYDISITKSGEKQNANERP